jgi:hypothetical protein
MHYRALIRVCLVAACLAAGCSGRKPMRVWGEVTFDGKPVEKGQIVFAPMDDTPGPTTGADIIAGRYEVPQKIGPWSGGTYQVEITALAKNGKTLPNPEIPGGPPVELADNYIPTKYNHQTELIVDISDDASKNQVDFHLHGP